MEENKDNTPSSNSLSSVKSHTDRTQDHTNDLRGDRKFADEFSADLNDNVYDDTKGPGTLPGEPDERTKKLSKYGLGSRDESLESNL
jgi:hypothetical protein